MTDAPHGRHAGPVTPTAAAVTVDVADRTLRLRLTGRLTAEVCPALRAVLLEPRPDGVQLVLVDAGAVTAVDDAVVAVLLAGAAWVSATGGRLRMTSMSASLRRALDDLGVSALLPVLPSAVPRQVLDRQEGPVWGRGARPAEPAAGPALAPFIPKPRSTVDEDAVHLF